MYCHYIDWCIGKYPLYRGVLYSECPLSKVPLYTGQNDAVVYVSKSEKKLVTNT